MTENTRKPRTFHCLQDLGYARLTARKIAEHANIPLDHITYHVKDMNEVLVETSAMPRASFSM